MTGLKIFQFSFGDGYAGSAKIALLSSQLLAEKGHSVTLFVSKNSFTEDNAKKAGIKFISLDSSLPYKKLKEKVLSNFTESFPQIVIGHHSLDRKIGIAVKRKFGRRIINISYRHNITRTIPVIGALLYNHYSDYLIACSTGVKNSLTSSGIKEKKIEIIHNGINIPAGLSSVSGDAVISKYNTKGKLVLGLSTWFHKERKGFDILFKAFSGLGSEYILLLAGIKGDDQNKVLSYAEEFGITPDRIILPGYVDNIWEYYKAMDLFLLPSRSEGFSLALLEAAAAKVPIIASNIPGNNEFIKNGVNGVLFNLDKPEVLTAKIQLLSRDKRMAKIFSDCAYRNVMNKFTITKYADHLEKFLLSTVK